MQAVSTAKRSLEREKSISVHDYSTVARPLVTAKQSGVVPPVDYSGMYGTDGRPVEEILAELDELAGDGEDYDDPEEDARDVADIDRIMAEIEAGRMKVYPAEQVYRELGLL